MKNFQIKILVIFLVVGFVSLQELESECFSSWISRRIGRRLPGDQLLFQEIKSSNWTSPTTHTLSFQYSNTNITQWELGFAPDYGFISHNTYWNPILNVQTGIGNTLYFEAVLTAYGFHPETIVPQLLETSEESEITTIYNPKKFD